MVRNVFLKKILKSSVFRCASIVNRFVSKDEHLVLLYSANMGIRYSLIPLKKYLLDHNYDQKYRIICGIESMKYAGNDVRVKYVGRLEAIKIFFKAKYVFYTAGQIPIKPAKQQCVIHMSHGNPGFKTLGKLTRINNGDEFFFTYMIVSAPMFVPITCKSYGCSPENIVPAGDPMIDTLWNMSKQPRMREFQKYAKLILWLPTFRQSDDYVHDDSTLTELVPMFQENEYGELNDLCKKYNYKLIVKLHTGRENFGSDKRHFEFLDIYTDNEFASKGYELYTLLGNADALIGDYSSASMQYLQLDRPQAYVVPDIEDYAKNRGFIYEKPEDYMAGHIIKTKEGLKQFFSDLENGLDPYAEKRKKVSSEVFQYIDNRNCERIVNLSGMKL